MCTVVLASDILLSPFSQSAGAGVYLEGVSKAADCIRLCKQLPSGTLFKTCTHSLSRPHPRPLITLTAAQLLSFTECGSVCLRIRGDWERGTEEVPGDYLLCVWEAILVSRYSLPSHSPPPPPPPPHTHTHTHTHTRSRHWVDGWVGGGLGVELASDCGDPFFAVQ